MWWLGAKQPGIFVSTLRHHYPPLGKPPGAAIPDVRTGPKHEFKITSIPATKFPIFDKSLGAFAKELRSEGFDARTDLYNGQLGLIVGPKGLDPKRMPPETAGLFFPLWELNYETNRRLVDARKFHDIFENRPQDWQYNRPYPKEQEHVLEVRKEQESGDTNAVATAKRRYIVEREFSAWQPSDRDNSDKHLPMRRGFQVFAVIEVADVFEAGLGFRGDEFIQFDMDAIGYEASRGIFLESVRLCTPEEIPPPPY